VKAAVDKKQLECPQPEYVDYAQYRKHGGYGLIADCLAGKAHARRDHQDHGGLRPARPGRAGFPAGRKWRIVAAEPEPRLMALNIDEGEPGTFKDRWYSSAIRIAFSRHAGRRLRARAWARSTIYLRDEYAGCRAVLEKELLKLKNDPPCALPPIHVRRGAGHTSAAKSRDDRVDRGQARHAAPAPAVLAQVAFSTARRSSTNLETVYWVRQIVERGAPWFVGHGRNGRKGLRSFSVSGRVKQPGVHLARPELRCAS